MNGRAWWSIVMGIVLLGATACKTTETTRTGGDEASDASAPGTKADIDEEPVTVLPDGGSEKGGEADAAVDEADGGASAGAVWVPADGDFVLEDRETGSRWNLRGEAYAGPMKGARLEQVEAFNSFWFAWSTFYDGSKIWQHDGAAVVNEPGAIPEGENCVVPCDQIIMGCPGKDCIKALDYDAREFAGSPRPKKARMVSADHEEAAYVDDGDFVFGVVVDGEPRAYPHKIYWSHEIHNDRVGETEFTVSFCPLTGSGLVFPADQHGRKMRFGVSGRLFRANLVMFDPGTDTFWSQMMRTGIRGALAGKQLELHPVVETTWERWKEMWPDTKVTSEKTGYGHDYGAYPYRRGGRDYRTDHSNTWNVRESQYEQTYPAKERTLGLPAADPDDSLAFPFPELDALPGDRNVVHARFQGEPIVVVYEAEHRMAIPFRTTVDGRELSFVGKKK